jgi:hypothetical protein
MEYIIIVLSGALIFFSMYHYKRVSFLGLKADSLEKENNELKHDIGYLNKELENLKDFRRKVVVSGRKETPKEPVKPNCLHVHYGEKEFYGFCCEYGDNVEDGKMYQSFMKWLYEKPDSKIYTFKYSNGASTTIFRDKITSVQKTHKFKL